MHATFGRMRIKRTAGAILFCAALVGVTVATVLANVGNTTSLTGPSSVTRGGTGTFTVDVHNEGQPNKPASGFDFAVSQISETSGGSQSTNFTIGSNGCKTIPHASGNSDPAHYLDPVVMNVGPSAPLGSITLYFIVTEYNSADGTCTEGPNSDAGTPSRELQWTLTVTGKLITVTADAQSKTYGSSDPTLTYTYTGTLDPGDSFSGSLSRASGENVGSYAINQGTLSLPAKYTLTFVPANLTINKAALDVNAVAAGKTYGQSDPALTATYSGFQFSDNAGNSGITGSASCSRTSGEAVATYTITCTPGTLSAPNYAFQTGSTANFTISPKALTITAKDASKTYGDTLTFAGNEFTTSGLVGSDSVTSVTLDSAGAAADANVNTYDINAGSAVGSGLGNYTITYAKGTLTVGQAGSTTVVTCTGSAIYDGTAHELCTVSVTGAGGLSLSPDPDYADNINAGIATASYTYAGDDNHTGSSDSKTFTIAPRPITVTADPQTKVQGDSDPALTYQITSGSLVGADGFSGALTRDPGEDVGPHAITQGTLSLSSNYDLTFVGDDLTITAAPKGTSVVVVDCPATRTYTGAPIEPCTAKAMADDMADVPLEVTYSPNVNVGTVTASASWAGDDTHTGNGNTATFDIVPAPSTVTVNCPASETHTGSAIEPCTATATGAGMAAQPLTVSYVDNVDVGTATASANWAGDDNHTGNSDSATFEIVAEAPDESTNPSDDPGASPSDDASASPSDDPSPTEIVEGETSSPTETVSGATQNATAPATGTAGDSGSNGTTTLFALLICLAFASLALVTVQAQRKAIRR
jgi:hypothetical protein